MFKEDQGGRNRHLHCFGTIRLPPTPGPVPPKHPAIASSAFCCNGGTDALARPLCGDPLRALGHLLQGDGWRVGGRTGAEDGSDGHVFCCGSDGFSCCCIFVFVCVWMFVWLCLLGIFSSQTCWCLSNVCGIGPVMRCQHIPTTCNKGWDRWGFQQGGQARMRYCWLVVDDIGESSQQDQDRSSSKKWGYKARHDITKVSVGHTDLWMTTICNLDNQWNMTTQFEYHLERFQQRWWILSSSKMFQTYLNYHKSEFHTPN